MSRSRRFGSLVETSLQQRPHLCGHAAQIGVLPHDRRHHVRHGLTLEQLRSGQHLVQHDAEGPDVGAFIDLLAAGLFRRHVTG
jgi:hypothetical protein